MIQMLNSQNDTEIDTKYNKVFSYITTTGYPVKKQKIQKDVR